MGSVLGETTRKGTRALKEPERAPLGAKMSSKYICRLTPAVCSGCLGRAQECLPSAQVKAAQAQILKRNWRKKKVESDLCDS
jgi:hypothetical protein